MLRETKVTLIKVTVPRREMFGTVSDEGKRGQEKDKRKVTE